MLCLLPEGFAWQESSKDTLAFKARTRVRVAKDTDRWHMITRALTWKASETAIVVCDMWDKHWCPTATERVAQMAPRMNAVLKAARQRGVFIIHCPSDTMTFYKDTPQRRLAQSAPKAETRVALQNWCHLDTKIEGTRLPIDDSDGGCDCTDPYKKNHRAWTRQIATIEIAAGDAITDNAEAFYLMKQRGIRNVIVMGVHTNMCVLGRPFSIRQMRYQGQNVVLMRDMTDTMYNPRRAPFVSHFTGTDLVVEHIEKYWCPTITSAEFLGGREFRFAKDTRKHCVVICAEQEYRTEKTLPVFAAKYLGRQYRVSFVFADAKNRNRLPGLDVIDTADVVLLSVRRRTLAREQMQLVRDYVRGGMPIVGIRTANHAFCLRQGDPRPGYVQWKEFDADVFGGSYSNHHGNGPETELTEAPNKASKILRNVNPRRFRGHGSLYIVSPLARSADPILYGAIPNASEPVAWTNKTKFNGRAFYTSLGHPRDFESKDFSRMLKNAIDWAASPAP